VTFRPSDLREVERLLESAAAVVAMREIHAGQRDPDVIGLRHDIDDNAGSLQTAVKLAHWEHDRGWRSTYFVLHRSRYWANEPTLRASLDAIAALGHEIGFHANAVAVALRTGGDPLEILDEDLARLRSFGHTVDGVAAHGDELCRRCGFVNDEVFVECARPEMGPPVRVLAWESRRIRLEPRPLAAFGLAYDTHRLPHGRYLSDSGGRWNEPFPGSGTGQLHVLMHSDWWGAAL